MPWAVAAAVIGAAATYDASQNAAKSQENAANSSNQTQQNVAEKNRIDQLNMYNTTRADQQRIYDTARADQAPYRQAGTDSLSQLAGLSGEGGYFNTDFKPDAFNFQADPGYAFRQAEGQTGLERSAAARGGLLSGATLKATDQYNQDYASNEYGRAFDRFRGTQNDAYNRFQTDRTNRFNRLSSLAGIGQTANNQVGAAGSNFANQTQAAGQNAANSIGASNINAGNNISANQLGIGNARSSGYIAQGNAISGGIGQLANQYQNYQYLNRLNQNQNIGIYV